MIMGYLTFRGVGPINENHLYSPHAFKFDFEVCANGESFPRDTPILMAEKRLLDIANEYIYSLKCKCPKDKYWICERCEVLQKTEGFKGGLK